LVESMLYAVRLAGSRAYRKFARIVISDGVVKPVRCQTQNATRFPDLVLSRAFRSTDYFLCKALDTGGEGLIKTH